MPDFSDMDPLKEEQASDFEAEVLEALRAGASTGSYELTPHPFDSAQDALLVMKTGQIAVEVKYAPRSLKQSAIQAARLADRARKTTGPDSLAMLILGASSVSSASDRPSMRQDEKGLLQVAHAAFRARGFDLLLVTQDFPSQDYFVVWKSQLGHLQSRWAENFSEAIELCISQQSLSNSVKTRPPVERQEKEPPSRSISFLLVGSEWSTSKGGISSFNIQLAKALISAGRKVCIAVPSVSETEIEEAEALGVGLAVSKHSIPGISGLPALLTGLRFLGKEFRPDVIVGHGRIIGPYAFALQSNFSRRPKRLHVVHMDPEALERAKEGDYGVPRTRVAADRKKLELELAASADVVAGVGPRLTNWISDTIASHAAPVSPPVVQIVPGLRDWGGRRTSIPSQKTVLFTGRVEDFESKGVGLAIEASARVVKARSDLAPILKLVIRGVPPEHAALSARITELTKDSGLEFVLREFTTDASELRADLYEASVVVMPSLHEGFGLSAYEAIAADIPVLVSSRSGLGDLISSIHSSVSASPPKNVIGVGTPDSSEKWADAICSILDDPLSAQVSAQQLRSRIESKDYWRHSIDSVLQEL